MLATLLAILPARATGRIERRALKELHYWTKNNTTLRTLKYDRLRRLLIWSTDHPIVFALLTGAVASCIAYLVAFQKWIEPLRLVAPSLKAEFDVATFTGVPWSIQATLVALVYPIVLSFIALMLQRKAHSTVALRVYVLDSAVVPAGASSIGLMVAMGIQYFATPYSSAKFLADYMAPLIVMNGSWMLMNVLLTGFFLSRTIRFIQEEEQRHAYTRVAVSIVLRKELASSIKQHIFVNAPKSDWKISNDSTKDGSEPRVTMFAYKEGLPEVKRDLKGSMVLHDVHLHLLKLVATGWSRRANKLALNTAGKSPMLFFPARVGMSMSGEVILCSVCDGPSLNRFERFLVRVAFVYRPSRQGTMSLSTRDMLEEIGHEAESAAEQKHYGTAEDRLEDMTRLHKTLLLASAADFDGVAGNAATIGTSPYAWGETSFDMEWLSPYWDVGSIAVNHLDEDSRLFRALAIKSSLIVADLPPRPEKLLINAQEIGTSLAIQLADWWTHKADASLTPGTTTFSGSLPAPLSRVYEQAIVSFIGKWGNFRVYIPRNSKGSDELAWQSFSGRALVYATHIENSADLFLKAVSRGDETASIWLLDNLLKWWGNRRIELRCEDIEHDFRVRHATMTLSAKDWRSAQEFLWDGSEPITIDFAKMALNLAIRRYWESMRLYVVLVLIENAGTSPSADSRELRHAAALIRGVPNRDGGTVQAKRLESVDDILCHLLGNIYGVESTDARIDQFAEIQRRNRKAPEVIGWPYSWSSPLIGLESMKRAQTILLVSLASTSIQNTANTKELIERWWRDIDKLESVNRFCSELRRDVLSSDFNEARATISSLQALLSKTHRVRTGQLVVANSLKRIRKVARHERQITLGSLSVDPAKVQKLGQSIAKYVFSAKGIPLSISTLHFVPGLETPTFSINFFDTKMLYVQGNGQPPEPSLIEHVGDLAIQHLHPWAFNKLVYDAALTPANDPAIRSHYEASQAEMQDYLKAVNAKCCDIQTLGEHPVVVVGRAATRSLLRAQKWGAGPGQCPLPEGIVVSVDTESNFDGSISLINGFPVFDFDTPNGDCYVLPGAMLKTLAVAGLDANSAMAIEWCAEGEDRLKFTISWHAAFVPSVQ